MPRKRSGSILKRRGSWWARVVYVDQHGARREKWRRADTRGAATDLRDILLREIDDHGPTHSSTSIALSLSRASMTTAQKAHAFHVNVRKLPSCGVWAVSVAECLGFGLKGFEDPLEDPPDPAHAVVDFNGLPGKQIDARGSKLARLASERGCLYRPDDAVVEEFMA